MDITEKLPYFAMALGLKQHQIEEIEADYRDSVGKRRKAVIAKWLKTESSELSWRTLCNALRSDLVEHNALAGKIETKYNVNAV